MDTYPLRILYGISEDIGVPCAMAVSVPKKLFRKAVDRNRIKRWLREAYRHEKPYLYRRLEKFGIRCILVIQFRGKEAGSYRIISQSLKKAMEKMIKELTGSVNG